jgi:diguanylate cyclase (GGDEF)-like protein
MRPDEPVGVLSDLSRRVREGTPLDVLSEEAVEAAVRLYPGSAAILLGVDTGQLVPLAARGFPGPVRATVVDEGDVPGKVQISARLAAAAGVGTTSSLAVPLVVRGREWAVLAIFAPDGSPEPAGQAGGLEIIAHLLATAEDGRLARKELEELQFRDAVTGLPGLEVLIDRLDQAIRRGRHERMLVAVVCIEIDGMASINDNLGQQVGDRVLGEIGARLRRAARPADLVARYGGARFVVLCEGLSSHAHLLDEVQRLQQASSGAVSVGDQDLIVRSSAGAVTARRGSTRDGLLRQANRAMREARQQAGSHVAITERPSSAPRTTRAAGLESQLRRALRDHQFTVHYQPVVAIEDGAVTSAEALVRWQHPRRGLLGPAEFIAVSEKRGLILPLGEWVLNTACRQARLWVTEAAAQHRTAPGVAVNLSARQVSDPRLVDRVTAALATSGLDPAQLTLEITETIVMADTDAAIVVLRRLKGLGLNLAIDDFGTGYSSLSYLKHFPVDTIKIDRSFIAGLGNDPDDPIIVGAIIRLADRLGVQTVAEGVETAQQAEELLRLGCTHAQGYFFRRPDSPEAMAAYLGLEPSEL